jgi:biotin carboxyl carrier protein
MGTVQCLPNGQLVALLKHRGTIGGYPAVAHVIRADWARLAQLVPGDWVQFEAVSYDQAISGWQQQQQWFVKPPVTRALRVTAAASGVVRELDRYGRPFVPVGAFVYPGQALAALDGDEGRVTVFSPGYGLVAERARTGEALRVGDTVAIIHEGWVDGED